MVKRLNRQEVSAKQLATRHSLATAGSDGQQPWQWQRTRSSASRHTRFRTFSHECVVGWDRLTPKFGLQRRRADPGARWASTRRSRWGGRWAGRKRRSGGGAGKCRRRFPTLDWLRATGKRVHEATQQAVFASPAANKRTKPATTARIVRGAFVGGLETRLERGDRAKVERRELEREWLAWVNPGQSDEHSHTRLRRSGSQFGAAVAELRAASRPRLKRPAQQNGTGSSDFWRVAHKRARRVAREDEGTGRVESGANVRVIGPCARPANFKFEAVAKKEGG